VNLTFSNAGQTNHVPINNVLLDGSTGAAGSNDGEQSLDIVQAIGMAPNLSQVRVYIGVGQDDANILNAMASENLAKQLSCSWSWEPVDPTVDEAFFQEMAAQGQSFFTASGDAGAYDVTINPYFYPAEDPYVTTVGGTHLTTSGPGGSWVSETVWNSGGDGSGGGISPDGFSIPSWQVGLANSANGGSSTLRNAPDVAMEGDFDNYVCYNGGCVNDVAGTSFAAPRWAGFMALALPASPFQGPRTPIWAAMLGLSGALALAVAGRRRRLRIALRTMALLLLLGGAANSLTGCAGSGSSSSSAPVSATVAPTPTGTYTIQIIHQRVGRIDADHGPERHRAVTRCAPGGGVGCCLSDCCKDARPRPEPARTLKIPGKMNQGCQKSVFLRHIGTVID